MKRGNVKRGNMKRGSVTVESALIVPIIIYIVCIIICQALIVGDRVIAEMTVDRVLEEACANDIDCNVEKNKEIVNIVKNRLSQMLLIHSVENVYFCGDEKEYEMEVAVKAKLHYKTMKINNKPMSDNEIYRIKRSLDNRNTCSYIRRIDLVKDVSE